jgi:uncharacterized protein YqhQ
LGYEAIKASAKYDHLKIVQFLILPGLGLQRITTNNPDDSQLEVAIAALKAALGEEYKHELVDETILPVDTRAAM